MADAYLRPYVDSSVLIALFKGEPGRQSIVEHIFGDASDGKYQIFISALTFAEVYKIPQSGMAHLSPQEDEKILRYFENDWFVVVDVDRQIGETANQFCREFNLKPNDAIHLACALRAKCDVLLAWDRPLISVVHPKIRLEEPRILGQTRIFSDATPSFYPRAVE